MYYVLKKVYPTHPTSSSRYLGEASDGAAIGELANARQFLTVNGAAFELGSRIEPHRWRIMRVTEMPGKEVLKLASSTRHINAAQPVVLSAAHSVTSERLFFQTNFGFGELPTARVFADLNELLVFVNEKLISHAKTLEAYNVRKVAGEPTLYEEEVK